MISKDIRCCGCTACYHACPVGAIHMSTNEEGYQSPIVDDIKCMRCNQCEAVCPQKWPRPVEQPLVCYAARHKDVQIVRSSSSGGIFTAMAIKTLRAGGVVFGAGWDTRNWSVRHMGVAELKSLWMLCGSKYVQSDLGYTYEAVRASLAENRCVLFSGTPCQVAGLRRLIGENEKLLLVEVFCHGVPSPLLFDKYKNELATKYGAEICRVNFRQKMVRDPCAHLNVRFKNGIEYVRNFDLDPFGHAFYRGYSLRESCYHCLSRNGCSGADISIGDYWGYEKHHKDFSSPHGTSAVVIRTVSGRKYFDSLSCIHKVQTEYSWIVEENPNVERDSHFDAKKVERFKKVAKRSTIKHAEEFVTYGLWCRRYPYFAYRYVRHVVGRMVRMLKEKGRSESRNTDISQGL